MKKKWTFILFNLSFILSLYSQVPSLHINQINDVQLVDKLNYTFAIIGDRTGEGQDPWTVFDETIESINKLNPDFVVMIGDLIQGGARGGVALQSRWQEALSHLEKLKGPLYIIPGNHDIWSDATLDAWESRIGRTYFKIICGDNLFLFLNTEQTRTSRGRGLGTEQMAFVQHAIESTKTKGPLFIFMHRPPWLEKGTLNAQWNEIKTLLEGKRYNLIAGHLHVLGEKLIDGNRHLIVGPTGGKMRLARNPDLGMLQHYTWVTVTPDTSIFQFIEGDNVYSEKIAIDSYARGVRTLRYLMGQ